MSNLATHRNGNEGSRRVLRRRAEALWAGEDWRAEAAKVHLFGWPQICGSLSERIENDSDFAMAVEELSAAMLGLREGSLGRRGAQSELAGMDHGAPEVARQLGGYGQWTRAADAMRAWRRDRPEEAKEWALQVEAKWLSRRRSWGRSSEALVKSRLALGGGAWTPAETDAALWILEDPRRAMGLDTGALLDDPMLKSCLDALGKESRSGNSWIAAKPSGEGLAGLRSALALAFEVSDLRDASGGRPPAKKAASRI